MHNNVKKQFIRALLLINEHYRDIYIKHYRFNELNISESLTEETKASHLCVAVMRCSLNINVIIPQYSSAALQGNQTNIFFSWKFRKLCSSLHTKQQ